MNVFKKGSAPTITHGGLAWWRRPSTVPLALLVTALSSSSLLEEQFVSMTQENLVLIGRNASERGALIFQRSNRELIGRNIPMKLIREVLTIDTQHLEIFSEWFHRLLVGIIAIPVLLNAIIARKMIDTYGKSVYISTLFSGILLIIQALVGALTVYMDNIDWSVALHLSLASIFTSSFLFQHFAMRRIENPDSGLFAIHSKFVSSSVKRVDAMAGAVFTLLILGAWVSTTAGGQYNQGCSVGFPNGWPKCNGSFLPSLDGPGILVQMIHRFGAVLVGLILVSGSASKGRCS